MDPSTFAGIGLALTAIFGGMILDGASPSVLIAPSALLLIFGGTFGTAMASGTMKDFTKFGGVIKSALLGKVEPSDTAVAHVVAFADKARRQGLLALEEDARKIDDPFLRKGIELAVDGTDPEELREILETQIYSMKVRHKAGAKMFQDMGGFAPTLGVIGTVIGLIHAMSNLSTPQKLGPMIAAAFTATLWGVMSANVFWLPIANKLKRFSELESTRMELVLEGILAIQAGSNPRVVEQKLLAYLKPDQKSDKEKAA
jgi:chemotaxis protein MotA